MTSPGVVWAKTSAVNDFGEFYRTQMPFNCDVRTDTVVFCGKKNSPHKYEIKAKNTFHKIHHFIIIVAKRFVFDDTDGERIAGATENAAKSCCLCLVTL